MLALGHELAHTPSQKFDLAHMRVLLEALEHPERRFPAVLIAGTNGKGSTAATLASILQASGIRTGLYTSPHLVRINERIRIQGEPISDDEFAGIHDLVDRTAEFSGSPLARYTNLPHREWIYRMAFETGRHIIGYEVDKVRAALDWLTRPGGPRQRVGVVGYGEGGLIAFYAAAVDTRIDVVRVEGYFSPREGVWQEPIYRNVFGYLTEFGDAELASLVAPRMLIVDNAKMPDVHGPPPAGKGRSGGAAPGRIVTPSEHAVAQEVDRAQSLVKGLTPQIVLSSHDRPAVTEFLKALGSGSQNDRACTGRGGAQVRPGEDRPDPRRGVLQVWPGVPG